MNLSFSIVALQVPAAVPPAGAPAVVGFTPLEVTKLVVAALTPLLVLLLGIFVHRLSKRVEHSHWANQKVIEKRIAIYDLMAPKLNELLCFCTFVGSWQTMTPAEALERKRDLDRQFYVSMALFSTEFERRYQTFINTCFKTYGGHGTQAKLRIGLEYRRDHQPTWRPEWSSFFVSPSDVEKKDVRAAYKLLMDQFATELGLALPQKN